MPHPAAPVTDSPSKPAATAPRAPCPSRCARRIPAAAAGRAPAAVPPRFRTQSAVPALPLRARDTESSARPDSFRPSPIPTAAQLLQSPSPPALLWRPAGSTPAALAAALRGREAAPPCSSRALSALLGSARLGPKRAERALLEHGGRSEEHTSELQSHSDLVCRLLLEKKKKKK